jgi:hypothetical protein
MCISAALIVAGVAVAAAGVGMYTSIQAANAAKDQAAFEAAIKEKELYNQREASRIEALQTENKRSEEFMRARSAAFASIGASGLGEHISFFNAIDPEAQKAFLRDVRAVRLNLAHKEVSIADQVKVTEYGADIAKFNAGLSKIGAIADFVKTAASAFSFYGMNASGGAGGASAGGGAQMGGWSVAGGT